MTNYEEIVVRKAEELADLRERLEGVRLLREKRPASGLLVVMCGLQSEIEKARAEYDAAFRQLRNEK